MRGSIVKRQGKATKDGKPITLYYIVYQVGKRQKWEAVPERTRKAAEKLLAEVWGIRFGRDNLGGVRHNPAAA